MSSSKNDQIDREAPTPRVSGSHSLFASEAARIVGLLERKPGRLAELLLEQAQALKADFDGWPANPPDVTERSSTIQKLMDLSKSVNAFLEGNR
jgi:hypothetical protein